MPLISFYCIVASLEANQKNLWILFNRKIVFAGNLAPTSLEEIWHTSFYTGKPRRFVSWKWEFLRVKDL